MRVTTAFNNLLALPGASVSDVAFSPEAVVVTVRLRRRRRVCAGCGQTGRWLQIHDRRVKRWRHLDLGASRCIIESELRRLRCPDCQSVLRPDRTKMNVEVDVCPQDHGILLDKVDLEAIVGPEATRDIVGLARKSREETGPCPNCSAPFNSLVINNVAARGCGNCGDLWFENRDLKSHVLEVRRRAYGERSMAARADVMRDATSFMPSEVVAGILTDYQLEHNL